MTSKITIFLEKQTHNLSVIYYEDCFIYIAIRNVVICYQHDAKYLLTADSFENQHLYNRCVSNWSRSIDSFVECEQTSKKAINCRLDVEKYPIAIEPSYIQTGS